jgi:hypothetical protein
MTNKNIDGGDCCKCEDLQWQDDLPILHNVCHMMIGRLEQIPFLAQ